MSTENNSNKLYNDSVKILSDLIEFKTISGEDNNSIINYCEKILGNVGASSFKVFDNDKKRVNLFSTLKSKKKNKKKLIIFFADNYVVTLTKSWARRH